MANAKTDTGAVTVKKETAMVAASFLEDDANKGLEGIQQEDLATPRIKVLMALSPELNEMSDAKAGQFPPLRRILPLLLLEMKFHSLPTKHFESAI